MSTGNSARPKRDRECDTIALRPDLLRPVLWCAGMTLVLLAASIDRQSLVPAAERTAPAFGILLVVIAGGAIAERLGVFQLCARLVSSPRVPSALAALSALGFTALISGAVNLDVAAVVAPQLAIRVSAQRGLNPGRMVIATALTANATSFLLPTSNLTTLLVLNRSSISVAEYVRQSWAPWLLVTVFTIGLLAVLNGRSTSEPSAPARFAVNRAIIPTILDLLPMFVTASAIRALLGGGLMLHGDFASQFALGSVLAAGVNNLPASAAVRTAASGTPWAVIWAMAIGPNLLITGSVATLICRRIALDLGVRFRAGDFSALGVAMLPMQYLAACAGLAAVQAGLTR